MRRPNHLIAFRFNGKTYEGRPTYDGDDTFDFTCLTLVNYHGWCAAVLNQDLYRARPVSPDARRLLRIIWNARRLRRQQQNESGHVSRRVLETRWSGG